MIIVRIDINKYNITIYNFFKNLCKHKSLSKKDIVPNKEYKNPKSKWIQTLERLLLLWKKFPNQPYHQFQILDFYVKRIISSLW